MPTRAIDTARIAAIARRSVSIITANQAPSGAYLASPTFPVYRYSWLRDGAFIADAMSRAGHRASADAFFGWCARVVAARARRIDELVSRREAGEVIDRSELLHTRYTLDGDESDEAWENFQLDGYGAWLWALGEHLARHGGGVDPYAAGVAASTRYLLAFRDVPSYDWWEEQPEQRHTSTLAAVFAGLRATAGWTAVDPDLRARAHAAADEIRARILVEGQRDGHLVKWLNGDAVDASLVACATPFGVLGPTDPIVAATVTAIEAELVHGGVHRYAGDTYYGGGTWVLLAGLLGWHLAVVGRTADAAALLDWMADQAGPSGELPEQVGSHLLAPEREAEWIARWGPSASPLLWSHAMFLTLALELGAVASPVEPGDAA